MTGDTTIRLTEATKRDLDAVKTDGETYDEAVARLVNDNGVLWSEAEVRELIRDELAQATHR